MKTKKQWQIVNGIVLANKPAGVSSNGFLQQVRRLYQAKKAGHTGALDPFATGLLPICFGEATKVSGLLLDSDKGYRATLKLGELTDSGDKDGEVIETQSVPEVSEFQIKQVFDELVGKMEQLPPMFSALKHKGKPLYEYARQGIEIERKRRQIEIYQLSLVSFEAQEIVFDVLCSKGTYVRTLGEEIAKQLGTVGHLTALHRTKTGCLTEADMHNFETLEQTPDQYLLPLDLPVQHLMACHLTAEETDWIQHGGTLDVPRPETDLVRFYDPQGVFFGVGEWQASKNRLKPKRLFNL